MYLVKKAVKAYVATHGKQLTETGLVALDRLVERTLLASVMATGNNLRIRDVEVLHAGRNL